MSQRLLDMVWREFGILTTVGNAYAFTHTTGWLIYSTVHYIISYSCILLGMGMLVYTNILITDRVSFMSQATHFLIVGAVAMTASVTLTLKRRKTEALEELFCNPESLMPFDKSEYSANLQKQTTRKKNRYILTWASLYGLCGLSDSSYVHLWYQVCFIQPLIDSLAGTEITVPVINGVWTNTLFTMWVPFDLENNYTAWLITFLFQCMYLLFCALLVTCATILCFTTSDRILDQLRVNIWAIKRLDQRAMTMFRRRYPSRVVENMEKEFEECFYDCIIQNVEHHLFIMRLLKKFEDLSSLPMAVPFFGGAVLLGMALITITAVDDPRVGPKVLAAILSLSEGLNMYTLCQAGQDFEELSCQLFEALFYVRWYNRSPKCRRALLIMRYGCTRPLKLTATRFITLNMEVFSDLVNSAYSLFNLMAARKV